MKGLSKKDIAALREGDVVYVRMEVRRPLSDFGTVQCRVSNEGGASHYVPVCPDQIAEIVRSDTISEIPVTVHVKIA